MQNFNASVDANADADADTNMDADADAWVSSIPLTLTSSRRGKNESSMHESGTVRR